MNKPFEQHGAFSWCELMTDDTGKAKEFYSQLFGWMLEDMKSPGMPYTVIRTGAKDPGIGGIMGKPPQAQGAPNHWGCYVTVKDVDATAEKAKKLGATIIVPPTDIPEVGRFMVFQDPQGAILSAITYTCKV